MGSKSLTTSFHCCMCCRYWSGTREINGFTKIVKVEDDMAKGKCINTKSFYNCQMSIMGNCPKFDPIV